MINNPANFNRSWGAYVTQEGATVTLLHNVTASSVPEKRRVEYYTILPAVVLELENVPGRTEINSR